MFALWWDAEGKSFSCFFKTYTSLRECCDLERCRKNQPSERKQKAGRSGRGEWGEKRKGTYFCSSSKSLIEGSAIDSCRKPSWLQIHWSSAVFVSMGTISSSRVFDMVWANTSASVCMSLHKYHGRHHKPCKVGFAFRRIKKRCF